MPSRHYQTSDYLKTSQERAAYLNAALNENDAQLFALALKNIALSEGEPEAMRDAEAYRLLLQRLEQTSDSLNDLLHTFGLRLAVVVENTPGAQEAIRRAGDFGLSGV